MKTYLDCIPCFFRQALETAKLSGASPRAQRCVLNKLAGILSAFSLTATPPEMGQIIYRMVSSVTGKKDPYAQIKAESNRKALKLYPQLKKMIVRSRDRLGAAVRLAIAGNIIDYGVKNSLNVERELKKMLSAENRAIHQENRKLYQCEQFRRALRKAETVLILGDNAGETVFDRLLIEEIKREDPQKRISYAVKAGPTINDALEEDARFCGIDRVANIISSGIAAPGTILSLCSRNFVRVFHQADMVISKGQGNFESLSDSPRPVFFFFMAKCPVVAEHVGCQMRDIILRCGRKNLTREGSK
ncbi:MAG: ARMT1-like domain-containing protein [Candidatus Omnitrophota bacterium]